MNKSPTTLRLPMLILMGLLHCSSSNGANAASLEQLKENVDSASRALVELDTKALSCLNSFNLNLGEAAALICDEFMRAVDGELLKNYISDCATLKQWREDRINEQATTQTNQDAQVQLQLLLAIEAQCGEDALQKRTEHVVNAFNTLRSGTLLNKSTAQSLDLRISELEFEQRQKAGQQSLLNSIQQQSKQSQRATQRQIDQLENELIRQQIKPPPN